MYYDRNRREYYNICSFAVSNKVNCDAFNEMKKSRKEWSII